MYQNRYNNLKIIELYLTDYNRKVYLREISKISKIPLRNVQVILAKLEKEKIIKSQIVGRNKYFYLNLDNIETKYLILKSEIYKTINFIKIYPQFNIFLKEIKDIDSCIIIFGSFAQFTSDKDSDLDLLVVSDKKINIPSYLVINKIHEINLNKEEFLEAVEKEETLIKKIRENHIILNNHSFFVNTFWRRYAK